MGYQKVGSRRIRRTIVLKVLYGVGEIANSVKTSIFGLFLAFFYTSVMGAPGALIGMAAGVGLIWDALIDPVIGRISDTSHFAAGRRHTFMLLGALTMGASFYFLFSPPRDLSLFLLLSWFVIGNLMVRFASSMFAVPYMALGAELSNDYDDRSVIAAFRAVFGAIGSVLVISSSLLFFGPQNTNNMNTRFIYDIYPALGLFTGLVMSISGMISTLGTWSLRNSLPIREFRPMDKSPRGLAGLLSVWKVTSLRALFISASLIFLGIVISTVLLLYFVTYYLGLYENLTLGTMQWVLFVGTMTGIPIWARLSKIIEKRHLYFFGSLATGILLISPLVLLGEGRFFGVGDARPVLVGQFVAGVVTSIFWILPPSMLADIVDQDALLNGSRREGTLFGFLSFGQQLATGLSVVITGILIDKFAGLVPGQAEQSAATIERIGILYCLVPAGFILAGALAILPYSLDRGTVLTIQAKLAERDLARE